MEATKGAGCRAAQARGEAPWWIGLAAGAAFAVGVTAMLVGGKYLLASKVVELVCHG